MTTKGNAGGIMFAFDPLGYCCTADAENVLDAMTREGAELVARAEQKLAECTNDAERDAVAAGVAAAVEGLQAKYSGRVMDLPRIVLEAK